MSGSNKLRELEEDIPYAQVLPLNPEDDTTPKAYAVDYKPYHDDVESQAKPSEPIASVLGEATVLENLGWDPETRKLFLRKVYSILTLQLLLTGGVSSYMMLHLPTQMYVLSHSWPVVVSVLLSFVLLCACMIYKVRVNYKYWCYRFVITYKSHSLILNYRTSTRTIFIFSGRLQL